MNRSGRIALLVALGVGGLAMAAPAPQEAKKGKELAQAATLPSHASVLTGLLPTQAAQGATPEQRLAQAKLIADGEHDPERALKLLTALAADTVVPSEVRAQAFVAAARCLNQLGRGAEAQEQLKAAAQLKGPGAEEAKRLLEGGLPDEQLQLRIDKAVDELLRIQADKDDSIEVIAKSQVARDLIWVGAPAVPRLVRILADVDHLWAVTRATYVLASINTDDAAIAIRDSLKRADPFYKRAVLAAFPPNVNWSDPIRATVMTLLNDPDPHVRQWVVSDVARLATIDELLPLTRDAEMGVRRGAWSSIRSHGAGVGTPDLDRVIAELRRCLKEEKDDARREAAELFRVKGFLNSAAARELLVTTLLDASLAIAADGRRPRWMPSGDGELNLQFDRPIPLDLLVDVANKLGTVATMNSNQACNYAAPRCELLARMVSLSSKASTGGQVGWPAAEREQAWRLVRFGLGISFTEWILVNATPEDVPVVVENAAACGDLEVIRQVAGRLNMNLGPAQRSAAAKALVGLFEADADVWERSGSDQPPARWKNALDLLATIGDNEADLALVRAQPRYPNGLTRWLLTRREPPIDPRCLVELVTIPTPKDNDSKYARNDALGRISAAHLPELPTILARCYELGLDVYNTSSVNPTPPRGFTWLVVHEPDGKDASSGASKATKRRPPQSPSHGHPIRGEWGTAYGATDVRTAFETCARLSGPDFWWDVDAALDLMPQEGPFDPVATELLQQVAARVPTLGDGAVPKPNYPSDSLIGAVLKRRAPGWKEFALANCLDPEIGDTVVRLVPELFPELMEKVLATRTDAEARLRKHVVDALSGEKDPKLRARAVDFLNDPSGEVRGAAILAVFATAPDRALDLVVPLAKDSNSGVRFKLYDQLASCFDRRAIPILVDGLQDSAPGNREVAKKSLDSLQYVFEQKEKWKRMLEGAGLDSANAAEALVKQAAASQPKEMRLVAIESLGTLGVAETLPVLITFMGEKDAEIAAAAKAAVEKINRRTSEKESAPAGKSPPVKGQ